ncbi:MAG: nicotinate (nicotinamide) nucleotide adenylyltransferase [Candidatus Pacebacteria bacterium]|nr:nicotinate (nicotinamide) nucleotide adenylyltransferase [Candidatus Paceibacterota bacterium]MBP9772583.1 nicotinate (nicotinamide) nucleotide adenylyltransferase [Candidatus Paceibacterota bacterium]QQR76629.1 MAG: nicotinate (nicotinamide) nucleotide adenylyltransferase [Candidatus Nomurabacteria bacterium]
MKHIALYFGSFNPIHDDHKKVIQKVRNHENSPDEIWVVVSPINPDKPANSLAPSEDRAQMVELAVNDLDSVFVSRVEFDLPTPSYTFQTLRHLHKKYSDHKFSIITGTDVVNSIPTWEFADEILSHHFYVVGRDGNIDGEILAKISCTEIEPVGSMSATLIREKIKKGEKPDSIADGVYEYIVSKNLYS